VKITTSSDASDYLLYLFRRHNPGMQIERSKDAPTEQPGPAADKPKPERKP
jgi:hypothetical protein